MVETIVPVAFFISFTVTLVAITRIVSEGRVRRRLIESAASPELAKLVTTAPASDLGVHASLQWGLVTGAVGMALVVIQYLPFRPDEPISFGILLLFASAGLIAYHFAGRRMLRQNNARVSS
jgi:hypothetical protein